MIAIFGDSHIRSLACISQDSTFYLGRGRDFRVLNICTIVKLSFRIFILNLFIKDYNHKILSFSEPFFRDLKYVTDHECQDNLALFFLRLQLLFRVLNILHCKPTHFLLPHSPDYAINKIVSNSLSQFKIILRHYSITPLFLGDSMFDPTGALLPDFLGFEFTNPNNYDKIHVGPYLGKSVSETFNLPPNTSSFSYTIESSRPNCLRFVFDYFFRWNPLFSCYRYQTFLLKLVNFKSSFTRNLIT